MVTLPLCFYTKLKKIEKKKQKQSRLWYMWEIILQFCSFPQVLLRNSKCLQEWVGMKFAVFRWVQLKRNESPALELQKNSCPTTQKKYPFWIVAWLLKPTVVEWKHTQHTKTSSTHTYTHTQDHVHTPVLNVALLLLPFQNFHQKPRRLSVSPSAFPSFFAAAFRQKW